MTLEPKNRLGFIDVCLPKPEPGTLNFSFGSAATVWSNQGLSIPQSQPLRIPFSGSKVHMILGLILLILIKKIREIILVQQIAQQNIQLRERERERR